MHKLYKKYVYSEFDLLMKKHLPDFILEPFDGNMYRDKSDKDYAWKELVGVRVYVTLCLSPKSDRDEFRFDIIWSKRDRFPEVKYMERINWASDVKKESLLKDENHASSLVICDIGWWPIEREFIPEPISPKEQYDMRRGLTDAEAKELVIPQVHTMFKSVLEKGVPFINEILSLHGFTESAVRVLL